MYPTVVIILVETQRSMADVYDISPSNASKLGGPVASEARPATLGHFSFAVGPIHSMTDNEAECTRIAEQSWAGTIWQLSQFGIISDVLSILWKEYQRTVRCNT